MAYYSGSTSLSSTDSDIFLEVYNAAGSQLRSIDIADSFLLDLGYPVVAAVSDTRAMVVWEDESAGDILAKIVNPSTGVTVVNEFLVAQHSTGPGQGIADYDLIATSNGRFALTYVDNEPGSSNDEVIFKVFNTNGTQFNAITAVASPLDDASQISTALLENGQIAIAWTGDSSGGSNTGIRVTVVNELGASQTGALLIPHTATAGNQTHPEVVGIKGGGFAVAWYDEPSGDIFGQRYDENFAKDGVEFRIEARSTSVSIADIEMTELADGRFQVVWAATASGDTDLYSAIWDPRDNVNTIPVYPSDAIIGTPQSDTINPVPAGAELIIGAGGNDTFWLNADSPRIGATYDGGAGTDTVGIVEPGTFNFYSGGTDTVFTDVETFKFNAGGASGLKTAQLTFVQALEFDTFDFAQGGANRPDTLVIADFDTGNTYDLSGLNIVDFESLYDTIRLRGFGGDDDITGTVSNDDIFGGAGLDTLDGHDGFDTLNTTDSGYVGDVLINLSTGAITSTQGLETAVNFENFQGGSANETIVGTDAHANELRGGGGNDVFDGGDFSDRTYGEGGDDTFIIREADDIDDGFEIIDGGTGTDTIVVGGGVTGNQTYNLRQDTIDSIEALHIAGALAGSISTQILQLSANQFNDGDVSLTSNIEGFNFAGRQEILEVFLTSNSSIDLSGLTFTNWSTADDLVRINGDSTGETIIGTSQSDEINSGSGDDTITIGSAPDTVNAGAGDDKVIVTNFSGAGHNIDGGADTDTIDFSTFGQDYTVNLDNGTWTQDSTGNPVTATLVNIENVIAGLGNDRIIGSNNVNHVLEGGGGNDFIAVGGNAEDVANGDGGDDTIVISGGNTVGLHTIDGGDDTDTLRLGFTNDAVVNLEMGTVSLTPTSGSIANLSKIENVEGSNGGNETFIGANGVDNVLIGKGGDDILRGLSGADTLDGGLNDDILRGDAGADALIGGSGIDHALYNNSDAAVEVNLATGTGIGGHAEGDTLSSIEKLTGSNGFGDRLFGDAQDNTLRGNGGNDTLRGDAGADILVGGSGSDWSVYVTSDAAVEVDLAAGTGIGGHAEGDTLSGIEKLSGSSGFGDRLYGDGGDNTLRGNGGDDILRGDAGADILLGGSGVDHALYNNSDAAVEVDLAAGTGIGGHAQGDTLSSIEKLTGSNGFGDTLYGNNADNTLRGNGGDDILRGDAGADILVGGSGIDHALYNNSDAAVEVDLAAGTGLGGHAEGDTLSSIEKLTGSNGFGDRLFGDAQDNTLRGNGGNDTLRGEAGADILVGGSGSDWSVYVTSDAAVEVDLAAGTGIGGHAEGDTLSGIEKLSGSSGFGDRLYGDGGDNTLRGNGGDDILRGDTGADTLIGGSGVDHALYNNSDAAVEVDLAAGTGIGGHAQGDTLSSIEKLTGSNGFGDTLYGNNADNTLRGNGGDDTLNGRQGNDTLVGGSGNDTFVFDANWGNDMVLGFDVSANEVLDFSSLGITQSDLTISYGASDTTITFAGNQIELTGSTATLLSDDFAF